MTDIASRRDGKRDGQRARELIVDAAEAVFAERGFHGARTEAMAKAAGYNISLLFQYFGNKLGLYSAVLERANRELQALQQQVLAPLVEDDTLISDPERFSGFLTTVVYTTFDYFWDHPQLRRVLAWEMADGWQTYAQIASRLAADNAGDFDRLFQKARRAGRLRSGLSPLIQLTLVSQMCQSYLGYLPLYQTLLPGQRLASKAALVRARGHMVDWVVAAMVADVPAPPTEARRRQKTRTPRTGTAKVLPHRS